jgi:hypothetical protein
MGALVLTVFVASAAQAAGNIVSKPTELKLAANTAKLTFSQAKFDLETGKYYKLTITSDGIEEIDIKAPALWENSYVNQLEINDVDVFVKGDFHVGFDSDGEVAIFFVPLRPGNFEMYAEGFQTRGLKTTFVVR